MNNLIITVAIIILAVLFLQPITEGFAGNTFESDLLNLAPARPQTEFIADGFLKHAIISPRSRIAVLSPTPPIRKTNCVTCGCPKSLAKYGMQCWYCAGFGREYEIQ